MNKLTKFSIKKFRNVAPTTLEFRPGLNVLLGKNAAGKTSLLRLLSTAVGTPDPTLQDDVLDVSYRAASASLELEHMIKRTRFAEPALPLDPSRQVGDALSSLHEIDSFVIKKNGALVMRAEVLPNEIVLEVAGIPRRVERRLRSSPIPSVVLALMMDGKDSESEALASVTASALVKSAGRMDESLERFNELLGLEVRTVGPGSLAWNRGSLPISMHEMLSGPFPDDTSMMFRLGFLDRTARVLGYASASARFDVERLSPEPMSQTVRLSNLRFFFKRPGEEISHDLLSYGQKRLLAFFAHADASQDLIIADELVNGLHHEWIEACLREIGDRQAFLTSQNPLLLDFLRFDSADEVRRTFILCERTSDQAGAQLVWRNPTEEEAESFFLAYQTGIQRVSDILLTKGLW